jgi:hypothetical protein
LKGDRCDQATSARNSEEIRLSVNNISLLCKKCRVRSFPVASSSLAAFKEPAADISHLKANRHRNQRNGKNHHHAYSRAHIIYSVLLLCGLHIVRSLGQREFIHFIRRK